jgi:hypothetical protein
MSGNVRKMSETKERNYGKGMQKEREEWEEGWKERRTKYRMEMDERR